MAAVDKRVTTTRLVAAVAAKTAWWRRWIVDGGSNPRHSLNLGGVIRPTGSDIAIVGGVGDSSGGVDNCDPERRTVRQRKLARRRNGNGSSGGGQQQSVRLGGDNNQLTAVAPAARFKSRRRNASDRQGHRHCWRRRQRQRRRQQLQFRTKNGVTAKARAAAGRRRWRQWQQQQARADADGQATRAGAAANNNGKT